MISGDGTYTLSYDAENRLTGVGGAATASFIYEGDGQRVKGTVEGVTTTYISNPSTGSGQVLAEWDGSSLTKYYYAGSQRIAMNKAGTLYWLLTDHLGSTAVTATSAGTLNSEERYMPWGEERDSPGTTPTSFLFTGQRSEIDEVGLYYYGARWYDPIMARWTSPDSIIPDPSNPFDWDRYVYSRNNPVKYIDPTGHWIETALDIAFIALDLYQINQAGWTLVNTVALVADVACAIIPIGTGGGPAVRAAMAGGDVILTYTRAAAQVPIVARAGQATEKVVQFADSSNSTNEQSNTQGHHPWPQYLLGPEKQELYNLDSKLHTEYHSHLDKFLSRRFGIANYMKLFDTQDKINQLLEGCFCQSKNGSPEYFVKRTKEEVAYPKRVAEVNRNWHARTSDALSISID